MRSEELLKKLGISVWVSGTDLPAPEDECVIYYLSCAQKNVWLTMGERERFSDEVLQLGNKMRAAMSGDWAEVGLAYFKEHFSLSDRTRVLCFGSIPQAVSQVAIDHDISLHRDRSEIFMLPCVLDLLENPSLKRAAWDQMKSVMSWLRS